MCGLYHAQGDEEYGLLGLASKPRSTVSLGLPPKSMVTVSTGLASKPVATGFSGLASKPVATIPVVWYENHSLRFPNFGRKTGSYGFVIWPTKSP
jgi:hypothetical protein